MKGDGKGSVGGLDWGSLLNAKALQKLKSLQLDEQAEKLLFADLKDAKLRKAMNDEPELLEGWAALKSSVTLRKSLDALNEGNYLLNQGITKNQLEGFAKQVDKAFKNTKNTLSNRVGSSTGFSLKHTDSEIQAILLRAKSLNLPSDEIDDFLYISCRDAKLISANKLMQQMDNWVNVVQKRGYPYKFNNLAEFNQFKEALKSGLDNIGVSISDVRVQGSALRTKGAKDVDLAAIISNTEFDKILIQRFSGRITKNSKIIDINVMNSSKLRALANEIESAPRGVFNNQGKSFKKAFLERKISTYSNDKIIPGAKQLYQKMKANYPHLNIENISVQTAGGVLDLKPYIKL